MKIYTVRIAADDTIGDARVGSITFEGVFAFDAREAVIFGEDMAKVLYGWNGPGMHVTAFQTGEEQRR